MNKALFFLLIFISCFATNASSQDWDWAVNCGNTSSDKALDVALDQQGNVFVSGYFNDNGIFGSINLTPNAFSKEAFICRLDSSGNFIWARSGGGFFDDRGLGLTVDPQGNVIYTGTYWSNAQFGSINLNGSADHVFVVKLDANGNWLWGSTGGCDGDDHGYDLVTDPAGNIFLTGYLSTHYGPPVCTAVFGSLPTFQVTDSIAFVARMSPTGQWVWVKTFGGTDVQRDNDIALDSAGNIYIAGGFYRTRTFGTTTVSSNNNSRDIFVVKYDANGNFQWVRTAGSAYDDRANGIAINDEQQIYITGEFRDEVAFGTDTINNHGGPNGRDIFVARLTTDGNWVWAKRAGSTSGGESGRAITVNDKGNVFVTGNCKGNVHFGNDTTFNTGADSVQVFVAAIDTTGDWKWAIQGGGPAEDRGYGIAVDTSCRLYVCGYFDLPTAGFGTTTLATYGKKDGFIARVDRPCFDYTTQDTTTVPAVPECTAIPPNVFTPNADGVNDYFELADASCVTAVNFKCYNRWGQTVYNGSSPILKWNGKTTDGKLLSDGVYYYALEITFINGTTEVKKGWFSLIR